MHFSQVLPSFLASTQQGCEQSLPAALAFSQQVFLAALPSAIAEPATRANAHAVIVINLMSFIGTFFCFVYASTFSHGDTAREPDVVSETGDFYIRLQVLSIEIRNGRKNWK